MRTRRTVVARRDEHHIVRHVSPPRRGQEPLDLLRRVLRPYLEHVSRGVPAVPVSAPPPETHTRQRRTHSRFRSLGSTPSTSSSTSLTSWYQSSFVTLSFRTRRAQRASPVHGSGALSAVSLTGDDAEATFSRRMRAGGVAVSGSLVKPSGGGKSGSIASKKRSTQSGKVDSTLRGEADQLEQTRKPKGTRRGRTPTRSGRRPLLVRPPHVHRASLVVARASCRPSCTCRSWSRPAQRRRTCAE